MENKNLLLLLLLLKGHLQLMVDMSHQHLLMDIKVDINPVLVYSWRCRAHRSRRPPWPCWPNWSNWS